MTTTSNITAGQAVRSLSGEFCLPDGTYAMERPSDEVLTQAAGTACRVLQKLVCVRSVDSMNLAASAAFQALTGNSTDTVAPVAELLVGESGRREARGSA